jgi:hypothetical protein
VRSVFLRIFFQVPLTSLAIGEIFGSILVSSVSLNGNGLVASNDRPSPADIFPVATLCQVLNTNTRHDNVNRFEWLWVRRRKR